MRHATTLILTLAMAVGAIGLAFATPGVPGDDELAHADLQNASGALAIANSRAGQSVFSAGAMRPGEGVSGTVRIGNDGQLAGAFSVRAAGVDDDPGPYGGKLSERVELVLFDVTDVQNPVTVFAGNPADFDTVALGTFAPGQKRDYLFAATLPDGGAPGAEATGDNRFQGSALSLGFEWSASAAAPTATPTPTPDTSTPPTTPPTVTPPTVTPSLADVLGLPAATSCVKRGKLTLRLKTPSGLKAKSATIKVNGRTKAKLKGRSTTKKVTLSRLGKKAAKLTVSLKASDGRTYTASRRYKACK